MPERDAAAVRVDVAGLVALLRARCRRGTGARPRRTPRSPRSPPCRPTSSPAFASARSHASGLPCSIMCGSTPAMPKPRKRARGSRPSSDAFCSEAMSTAAEPSTICDEFPAVTTPSGMNAGCSDAIFSSVVSRIASSTAKRVRVSVAVPPPPSAAGHVEVDRDDLLLEAPLVARARRARMRLVASTGRAPRARASTSSRSPRPRCPASRCRSGR